MKAPQEGTPRSTGEVPGGAGMGRTCDLWATLDKAVFPKPTRESQGLWSKTQIPRAKPLNLQEQEPVNRHFNNGPRRFPQLGWLGKHGE